MFHPKPDFSHRKRLLREPEMFFRNLAFWGGMAWTSLAGAALPQLAVQVEGAGGGQVDGLPDGSRCRAACVAVAPEPVLVSLLAEPEPGYRFAGWEGACETTLGPLCTLPLNTDAGVGVRFARETTPESPEEAVLLLHDAGELPAVWNKAVDRQFGGLCPVVYGGVPLTRAPQLPANSLHCYRLRFGYYAALGPTADSTEEFLAQWAAEIRAAVAGLMDAHPRLRLVLVGKGYGWAAARTFQATPTPERASVAGWLAVDAAAPRPAETSLPPPAAPAIREPRIATTAWKVLRSP